MRFPNYFCGFYEMRQMRSCFAERKYRLYKKGRGLKNFFVQKMQKGGSMNADEIRAIKDFFAPKKAFITVLAAIGGEMNKTEITKKTGLCQNASLKTIKKLMLLGYAEENKNAGNGREKIIRLTESGLKTQKIIFKNFGAETWKKQ